MRYAMRSVGVLSVVASMMLGLGMTQSQAVSAVAPPACAAKLGIEVPSVNDALTQTRVLTVHGLRGDDTTFDAMEETLKQVDDIKVDAFSYKSVNDRWVTDPAIGQRLAKYIVCYSLLYKQRPVVVTHSMGGLAAREASDWAAYGVFAKDVIGHLVTIAPPHTGALPANIHAGFWLAACKAPFGILSPLVSDACRQIESTRATSGLSISSDQLAKLAKFPSGVSVKTIAGDVSWSECAPWGCSPAISTGGDLVVSVASATAYYTSTGKGDGKTVFTCDTGMPVGGLSTAWCEHSNMLRAPQVQAEVKKSIEQYIASTKGAEYTFHGLTVQASSKWSKDGDSKLHAVSSCIKKSDGRSSRCPGVFFVDPQDSYFWDMMPEGVEWGAYSCPFGADRDGPDDAVDANVVQAKGTRTVGGLQAGYYEVDRCTSQYPRAYLRVWKVPSKRYAIMSFEWKGAELTDLSDMLERATWK